MRNELDANLDMADFCCHGDCKQGRRLCPTPLACRISEAARRTWTQRAIDFFSKGKK